MIFIITMTVEEFIDKANKIYDGKYDYSSVKEIDKGPILIKCPKHGGFFEGYYDHLKGYGCPKCFEEKLANNLRK